MVMLIVPAEVEVIRMMLAMMNMIMALVRVTIMVVLNDDAVM